MHLDHGDAPGASLCDRSSRSLTSDPRPVRPGPTKARSRPRAGGRAIVAALATPYRMQHRSGHIPGSFMKKLSHEPLKKSPKRVKLLRCCILTTLPLLSFALFPLMQSLAVGLVQRLARLPDLALLTAVRTHLVLNVVTMTKPLFLALSLASLSCLYD